MVRRDYRRLGAAVQNFDYKSLGVWGAGATTGLVLGGIVAGVSSGVLDSAMGSNRLGWAAAAAGSLALVVVLGSLSADADGSVGTAFLGTAAFGAFVVAVSSTLRAALGSNTPVDATAASQPPTRELNQVAHSPQRQLRRALPA